MYVWDRERKSVNENIILYTIHIIYKYTFLNDKKDNENVRAP